MLLRRIKDKDGQEGYMMKKIILEIVATNIVASLPPVWQPTAHAKTDTFGIK